MQSALMTVPLRIMSKMKIFKDLNALNCFNINANPLLITIF